MSLIRLDTAGALGPRIELDLSGRSQEELEAIAAPFPARWLFEPEPGEPDRVVYLFCGPGGLEVGIRDVLGLPLDIVGVELNRDASATATAAGFQRITMDVRDLDPWNPALRWVRGLIVTAPCQCWTPAGKRAGQDPRNQELLLDVFTMAFEATFGHWHDSRECGPCEWADQCLICSNPDWDGYSGFTGPLLTFDEVRSPIADMTDERIGLIAEVLIWSLALTAQWDNLRWLAMEQSSALPENILDGIREELWAADWCSAEYRVLDAVDYGLASRRKRVFLMAARHAYVDMEALTPKAPLPSTTAAEALGWPSGIRVNTRGVRKTAGGNCWSADKPATGITSKIRGWYWEHDKDRRFSLDEAALLVGFRPGYPWTGSRSSCTQQIGDVVAPPMGAVVMGALLGKQWEPQLHAYLAEIYDRPAAPAATNEERVPMTMKAKLTELKAGQKVRAVGRDTRGHTVTREGYLVADPMHKTAAWDGTRTKVIRLHVDPRLESAPTRQNWVTMLPEWEVELLEAPMPDPIPVPAPDPEQSTQDETPTVRPAAPLIGIAGAARAGKDTAAQALAALDGERTWQRRAFADPIKRFLYALNPMIDSVETAEPDGLAQEVDKHGWERVKDFSWDLRGLMQRCGTEAGRTVLGEDVWVRALFNDLEPDAPTVITDVRFPNEAEEIRKRGGIVIKLVRPDQPAIREASHSSETALDGWGFDAVLENAGSPEELGREVLRVISAHLNGKLDPSPSKG
ncbi:DNA cytosine methyltransferase [Streptomyces syringium]|uniref:deoxynucleotide monophosphate kinase family protein n=1 Tax=Streptomyces syringium TaxID=76729 RepID=UPI0033BA6CE6